MLGSTLLSGIVWRITPFLVGARCYLCSCWRRWRSLLFLCCHVVLVLAFVVVVAFVLVGAVVVVLVLASVVLVIAELVLDYLVSRMLVVLGDPPVVLIAFVVVVAFVLVGVAIVVVVFVLAPVVVRRLVLASCYCRAVLVGVVLWSPLLFLLPPRRRCPRARFVVVVAFVLVKDADLLDPYRCPSWWYPPWWSCLWSACTLEGVAVS